MTTCSCGFTTTTWNVQAYRAHERQHLAAYPTLDDVSRSNLRQFVVWAEEKAANAR